MKRLTIRKKLTLWYAATLLLLLGFFVPYLYVSMSNIMYRTEESLIKVDVYQAISLVDIENEGNATTKFKELKTSGTNIYLFDLNNQIMTGTGPNEGFTEMPPDFGRSRYLDVQNEKWILFDQPVYNDNQMIAWVRGSRPLKSIGVTLHNLVFAAVPAIPIYIMIAIAGGLFISGKALSPIDRITKTALEIGHGNLKTRLNLPKVQDEVGRLSAAFDEMLDRLEASFIRERQFTSDASHELRTPIAVISAHAEEALSEKRTLTEVTENMAVILKESRSMSHMVSQLLFLARCDEGRTQPEFEDINLSVIVKELCEELEKLATNKNIGLSAYVENDIIIKGDQTLLTMALMNLIENAIKYNKPNGKIEVSLLKKSESAEIIVHDTGIGILEEEISHLFDRFYRADKSRARTGTGLGLSIVKWIVDAHHGSISIESSPGLGTIVNLGLPVLRI